MRSHQPVEDAQLTASLEDLRQMAAATWVCLRHGPEGGCCARAGDAVAEATEGAAYAMTTACPGWQAGQAEVLVGLPEGAPHAGLLLCVTSPLPSGRILALQLGFSSVSPEALPDPPRLAKLSHPLLMWARYALERHEAEARSQAVLQDLIRVHEEEREWLAYEVHDRLAQTLVSAFQQLQAVEALARSLPEIRQAAVRGSVLLREAIREARAIMNELRPPLLDEVGLAPLVEEEVRRLEAEQGLRAQVTLSYTVRPPREVEVVLYRILHEALANIRRHAQAREVAVFLAGHDDGVRLQVKDDGVGFDVPGALARARVGGLMSMKRRADFAGGACWIESEPGKGTQISVSVPAQKGVLLYDTGALGGRSSGGAARASHHAGERAAHRGGG